MENFREVDICSQEDTAYKQRTTRSLSDLKTLNRKFRICCKQVILLNNEIEHLQQRIDTATKYHSHSFLYMTKLKLASVEGIRNVFFDYACDRATELDGLHNQLVSEGVIGEDMELQDLEDWFW